MHYAKDSTCATWPYKGDIGDFVYAGWKSLIAIKSK